MEKEFVPYELAVKLKELGFDELCLCHYHYGNILRSKIVSYVEGDCLKPDKFDKSIPAPLWQQVFDWFREKHGFDLFIKPMSIVGFTQYYDIELRHPKYCWGEPPKSTGETYEQARRASLEKLIELIQNK